MKKSALTLQEYLMIVVLFLFFCLIVYPVYSFYIRSEQIKQAREEIEKIIAPALQRLYEETGTFPPSKFGDDPDLTTNQDHLPNWQGPYLKEWPSGPPNWNPREAHGAYQFRNFYYQGYHVVVIWCYGPNRIPEADITQGPEFFSKNPKLFGDDLIFYLWFSKS
jgi:hypothetical protein